MTEAQLSSQVRRVVLARESTYNTDEIDLANNLAVDRTWQAFDTFEPTPNIPAVERNIIRPSFGRPPHISVRQNISVECAGEVCAAPDPDGSGTEAPDGLSDILVANGFGETIVSAASATYAPKTPAQAGLSAYVYARELSDSAVAGSDLWRLCYLTGLRGRGVTITGSAGEILRYTSTLESANYPYQTSETKSHFGWSEAAQFFDTSDGTIALDLNGDAITYTGTETTVTPNPLYLEAATVKLGAGNTTFDCSAFTVTIENTVKLHRPTRANPVVDAVLISGRRISYELTLEGAGAAYDQFLTDLHANSTFDVEIVATDRQGSNGSTLTITSPICQFDQAAFNDSGGLAAWTIPVFAQADYSSNAVGDNDISLAWTVTA